MEKEIRNDVKGIDRFILKPVRTGSNSIFISPKWDLGSGRIRRIHTRVKKFLCIFR